MIEEQAGVDVVAEVDAELLAAFVDDANFILFRDALVLMAFAAIGEALAALDEDILRVERGARGFGEGIEPGLVRGIDAVVVDHERTVVGVDRDRQLGDVFVVDAPARDGFALGPLTQVARVLLHPVREHLGKRHQTPATPRWLLTLYSSVTARRPRGGSSTDHDTRPRSSSARAVTCVTSSPPG